MNRDLYNSIVQWQDKIFTKATPLSCVNHLKEEVKELKADIENADPKGIIEAVDCLLLLFGIFNKLGMNYDQIVMYIDHKMEINRKRKWGEVNAEGYVKHVEDPAEKKLMAREELWNKLSFENINNSRIMGRNSFDELMNYLGIK